MAADRVCVNRGRTADASLVKRGDVLPECVGPEGLAACTFDLTAEEAWQHWRREAHRLGLCIEDARRNLARHDDPRLPKAARKQALDDARAFLTIAVEG